MKIEVFNLSRRRIQSESNKIPSEETHLYRETFIDFDAFQHSVSWQGLLFPPTVHPLDPDLPIPTFFAPHDNKGAFVRFTHEGREILCNTMDLLKCRSIAGADLASDVTIEEFVRYLDTHEGVFSQEDMKHFMHELHPDVMT